MFVGTMEVLKVSRISEVKRHKMFAARKMVEHLNEGQEVSSVCRHAPPRWSSGKVSASRAEDPGFESRLRQDFFGVESYQ